MGNYDILEIQGYVEIRHVDTLRSWDCAVSATANRRPITTSAQFYAKKDGKCFKISVERKYRNRTSAELHHARIASVEEVTEAEYAERVRAPLNTHKRW
ncbi:MAG: hypothetical protein U0414_21970 [Polyangiaceae bacterium]